MGDKNYNSKYEKQKFSKKDTNCKKIYKKRIQKVTNLQNVVRVYTRKIQKSG